MEPQRRQPRSHRRRRRLRAAAATGRFRIVGHSRWLRRRQGALPVAAEATRDGMGGLGAGPDAPGAPHLPNPVPRHLRSIASLCPRPAAASYAFSNITCHNREPEARRHELCTRDLL